VTGLGDRSESWTGSRQLLVRGASFAAQPLAERGQPDPAAGAVHELSTQLVFELANGLADARRRQIEPLGRPPEVQLVGQSQEDARSRRSTVSHIAKKTYTVSSATGSRARFSGRLIKAAAALLLEGVVGRDGRGPRSHGRSCAINVRARSASAVIKTS
jgi:hypothetical protein